MTHAQPRRRRRASRLITGALTAALTVFGLGAISTGTAAAADNLLLNAGFEAGSTGSWTCTEGTNAQSSTVHTGSHALTGAPAGLDYAQCSQQVTVQPNSEYKLSGWVQGPYVYLGATGTGGTDPSTWTSSSTWTQLNTSFTTGANTTKVTVYVHGWYGQAAYFADDLVLSGPGEDPEPPQLPTAPTGLTAGTPTSSSVPLSWNPVSGATSYQVYRDGNRVSTATSTSTTVTGLSASTAYSFQVSAVNAAGESARSAAVTVTTKESSGGGDVPKHALTGYWQNFDNGAALQRLGDVQSQYDIIAVAFADATTQPGAITFNLDPTLASKLGGYTKADFIADIQAKQAQGKKVILSVGGEKGTISVGSTEAATNFANSAYALAQEYGFDGVDIDLENGVNPTYMSQALHSLASKMGAGFVLTMAPQTIDMQSTQGGYFQLALKTKDILTVVNMQYYNSGSMLGCDGKVYSQGTLDFLTALACIQLEGGLDPSQVGLGVPASSRAAGGGQVAPSVVNNALDCLARGTNCGTFKPSRTYPGIRGAMTWSTNWDQTNGNAFSNTVGPHVHALP
ncbi:chitinase [Wenjunlia vitaminophila]|uniref:chitinase n=1 Tax=Wenjunlia vitaminophila TaxID=76728 RepID=A0A0T6LLH7_WENVI|nr:glycoside hydrolase family 18 protein [Wenjunlia vitaminophila]KRV46872.1 chitinase [Wenjunlia vitaminophila]